MQIRHLSHLLMICILLSGLWASPGRSSRPGAEEPGGFTARIYFETEQELQALTRQLDVWEIHRVQHYIIVWIDPEAYDTLLAQGWKLQRETALRAPDAAAALPCYRTVAEMDTTLDQLAAGHPEIARLKTIGTSVEGRPLRVLQLSNWAVTAEKPVFFLMANIHGRELITPEVALNFIDTLVDGYGVDADITWMLDTQEIDVLVSANPDGHVRNETELTYWRKNTRPDERCDANRIGVDLNRNFAFGWGDEAGASSNPCSSTYFGSAAASEPETRAVQDFVAGLFSDKRGVEITDAAPVDTEGIVISLHSYGDLVLWPWGNANDPAPNEAELRALGRQMAALNGYTPQQASDLYPTSGSTDDWVYGNLGTASFTFEIGSGQDGFFPECSRYEVLVQPNLDALLYAARVARAPYQLAQGSSIQGLKVSKAPEASNRLILEAQTSSESSGSEAIAAVEYTIDEPPWIGSTTTRLAAKDGAYDAALESVQDPFLAAGRLTAGKHILYLRSLDVDGNWGPTWAVYAQVGPDAQVSGKVVDAQTGAPLSGVKIKVKGGSFYFSGISDESGDYHIPVAAGTYRADLWAAGYRSLSAYDLEFSSGITTTLVFSLTAGIEPPVFFPFLAQ